jgi:serine O-acetyltransferase
VIFKRLRDDVHAILARDPAALHFVHVLLCYPGVHALCFHRLSHWLWRKNWRLAANLVSFLSRFITGIEIHPGAVIGDRVFIDHGMGTVIGETAVVGNDCTIYHGVTLGGVSLNKGKRHPTLGDGVSVGAGAKIMGPIEIGDGAKIGPGALVVRNVAPKASVIESPSRIVHF